MNGVTRREAFGLAATAGLVVTSGAVINGADEKPPTTMELFEKLKLTDEKRRPAGIIASQGDPPVLLVRPKGVRLVQHVKAIAQVSRIEFAKGKLLAYGLTWTLDAMRFHDLYINDTTPLKARSITFQYGNISWQPGEGWPVYHVRCPRDDYGQNFAYPNAKFHSIVHSIGNMYSVSCLESGNFSVNDPDQVRCAVNDVYPNGYDDNRGTWDFTLTSWN